MCRDRVEMSHEEVLAELEQRIAAGPSTDPDAPRPDDYRFAHAVLSEIGGGQPQGGHDDEQARKLLELTEQIARVDPDNPGVYIMPLPPEVAKLGGPTFAELKEKFAKLERNP
jgi:hypothetical protein